MARDRVPRFRGAVLLTALVLLCSCATRSDRETRSHLLGTLSSRNYRASLEIVQSDNFYPEERSTLLRELERGTVLYLSGNYYQALENFDRAHRKSDELFTKSIRGKMKSLVSENLDNYYGERYERSLIRFYESLVNYKLYKSGLYEAHIRNENGNSISIPEKRLSDAERRRHLLSARSLMIEWDSLMASYRTELAGQSTYKVDLLAKLWAGFIHEEFNSSEDRQIALQLYRDAKDVLLKNYSAYPTFNDKHRDFNANFSKFTRMPLEEIGTRFIAPTPATRGVSEFIDSKIAKLSENRRDNLTIILREGLVSPKTAKSIRVSVPLALLLIVGSNSQNFINFVRGVLFSLGAADLPMVEFELPQIRSESSPSLYQATIFDSSGLRIDRFPLVLVEPVSEIAAKSLEDRLTAIYLQTIATVTAKYATAMYSAYKIYLGNRSEAGKMLALLSYGAASRAIAETTRADLRQWSSLPSRLYIGSVHLRPGRYSLAIEVGATGATPGPPISTRTLNIGHSQSELVDVEFY
jgi:hypothetical protein